MGVYRKKTVRWSLSGKRVAPHTSGAKRVVIPSKRFYGTLRDADGKRRQIPLSEDKNAAKALLRRLQTEADYKRAAGVDRHTEERHRPLKALLGEYENFLRSKANTERYVLLTSVRITAILHATKATTLADLDASRVSSALAEWRSRSDRPIGVSTSNHYARAIKGFTRWLWMERRTLDDPLSPLRLLNARVDRRRNRRALTLEELQCLLDATKTSRKTLLGLNPTDRAMLYTLATFTGLRASELASLTTSSFNLETNTVSVQAAYSKRRRHDTLPLHRSLIELLRPWLATKKGTLWRTAWCDRQCTHTAKLLRKDLKRAGIPYRDEQGRVVDFHALRHTFISSLARSGVHPAKAKELARHSTIMLTMDVYSHVEVDELRSALEMLPPL